jgi:hypothetical protein
LINPRAAETTVARVNQNSVVKIPALGATETFPGAGAAGDPEPEVVVVVVVSGMIYLREKAFVLITRKF